MSLNQKMQELWAAYEAEHGVEPSSIGDCFEWATRKELWAPKPISVAKIFQREMADALRVQMRTDASGRTYRAKLCVRESMGGLQMSLWGDADLASQSFVERSVRQRRESLVDDGFKLKQDVDHFNEYRGPTVPIQLVLDLTLDVAEREASKDHSEIDESEEKSA